MVRFVVWIALLFIGLTSNAFAQNSSDKRFNFSVDFVNLNLKGNDSYPADIVRYRQTDMFGGNLWMPNSDYRADYEPLIVLMDNRRTVLWEASYGSRNNYLSFRTWRLNTGGSIRGNLKSPEGDFTTFYLHMVRMWDQTLVPLTDNNEKSNRGQTTYWLGNELRARKTDIAFGKSLSENLDLLVGVTSVGMSNDRNEGQTRRAFLYAGLWPEHFDNLVTLESYSGSKYQNFWGPSFGIKGKMGFKRFEAQVNLNQSFLTGNVKQSGNWIDIDDISAVSGPRGGPFSTPHSKILLHGEFPYSIEQRKFLTVFDSQAKLNYRLTDNLTVGGSLVASYWSDVAIAPSWSVPGAWTSVAGSGWKLNNTDLLFHGYSLSLGLRF